MQLIMLGTGNAHVTKCYNTCFALAEKDEYFLVDGGGGNGILLQLEKAGIPWQQVKTIFVTHKHIDHLLGIVWLMRFACEMMSKGKYAGEVNVYAPGEVVTLLKEMAVRLLQAKSAAYLDNGFNLHAVSDGEKKMILQHETTFFDIGSTKTLQYGFSLEYAPGRFLTCCGDEPCSASGEKYAAGSEWLLHEAFCLERDADIFHPYEKHHSTVEDACRLAERLQVKNLLLYHTEDKNIAQREELYLAAGKKYFTGGLYVPCDLTKLKLE